jgi:hypothetical protein
MTPEQLHDLRFLLLREFYRVQPRGRSARTMHSLVRSEVDCALADVQSQIAFLEGERHIAKLPANKLAPGLDPLYAITSAGMKFCEEERLV